MKYKLTVGKALFLKNGAEVQVNGTFDADDMRDPGELASMLAKGWVVKVDDKITKELVAPSTKAKK